MSGWGTKIKMVRHVPRRDGGYSKHIMLKVELPGRRKRAKPQRRFMDVMKDSMQRAGVIEEDVSVRVR